MGYDFQITRADEWYESETNPISQEEWETVAERHPGLRQDGTIAWTDIGTQTTYAIGESTTFYWRSGMVNITGRFTDDVQAVANEIAAALDARVLGDED